MIQWSDDLSVGHKVIDDEHKSLFEALNAFYEGIRTGQSGESMGQLIGSLLDYTKAHFAHEEEYMKQIQFPGLEAHQKEHHYFVNKVSEFYDRHKAGKLLVSFELTNFIKEWITNHIKMEDRKYARYAETKA